MTTQKRPMAVPRGSSQDAGAGRHCRGVFSQIVNRDRSTMLPDIRPNSAQHHPGLGSLVPMTQSPVHQ